jgi:ClpP class serine protease
MLHVNIIILSNWLLMSTIPFNRLSFGKNSEFQTVTAGKYKRTITPTKKVTKEDFKKSSEDVAEILELFSTFVKQNRPQLDMEKIATGETWFGTAALEKGLCDEIKTVDEVLTNFVDSGYNVYEVEYSPPPEIPGPFGQLAPAGSSNDSFIRKAVRSMVRFVVDEIKAEFRGGSIENRYQAKDDSADRFRAES